MRRFLGTIRSYSSSTRRVPVMSRSQPETIALITAMEASLAKLKTALAKDVDSPEAVAHMTNVRAAEGALEALVLPPQVLITRAAIYFEISGALGTVLYLGIPEIIGTGGEKGMSSKEIEAVCGLPYGKVSRHLRLLVGQGIFQELRPDIWAHNRVSKLIDSGRPYEEFIKEPIGERFSKTSGIQAWAALTPELGLPGAAAKMKSFHDNERIKKSYDIVDCPLMVAHNTGKTFWEWLETDGDGTRVKHCAKALEVGNVKADTYNSYPWASLGEDAVLVDVGAGIGSASAEILKVAPNIKKVVLQDREGVLIGTRSFWKETYPQEVEAGRVEFQTHDFFTEQPVKDATVYFLRWIVHDWADEPVVTILTSLAEAASSTSRLLIQDAIIDHACHDIGGFLSEGVEGAYPQKFPWPLPANGGKVVEWELMLDMHMMNNVNGQERTFVQLKELAALAGWKPTKVYAAEGSNFKITEFVKAGKP